MIPLTIRSNYSLMWGASPVEFVCRAARLAGYRQLALTDTDNLYGLWPFLEACRREDIQPIIGAELTDPYLSHRAICLVENAEGYRNLCRLLTRRHCDEGFSLATALPSYSEGLSVLTQSTDLLSSWHASGVRVAAACPRQAIAPLRPLVQDARRLGVPLVATPGSFFMDAEDYELHRMMRAIDLNTSLSRLGPRDVAPPEAWLAQPEVYRERFEILPEALRNTFEIAERCEFRGPDHGLVLPPYEGGDGRSGRELLRQDTYAGAVKRYGQDLPESVVERLEHELGIIEEKHFSEYFLVVRDIVRLSPRICGRGSGAASLVAYCLEITNVCPMKHKLYFERFLNPGRQDPPDIDVDFAWDERDDVLWQVFDAFPGRSAMVCNHVMFQPRMAVREVAKVYGLTDGEIGQVSKRLPWFWRSGAGEEDLMDRIRQLPRLRDVDFPHPWPRIVAMAQRLIGTPRHISVHSGGVVITPRPIEEYVPIQIAPKGVPILQWEKEGTEESGLVKIDLLGNRSLGVIRDAMANVKENGLDFDEKSWEPEDDEATQESVSLGDTMGCFYVESPATRLLQKKAGMGDFEHMVIHSSIIRPAANEFIREYLRRLKGGKWEPIHPLLGDVLDETFGIMVYQEDVSRVAVVLAGFSHTEADGLRKIMSKKNREAKLQDYFSRFVAGARARGVSNKQIDGIWAMMMSFSGYSFCKPHSASYARVSFQSVYLKTHHPAEFMGAVISNQGGFYGDFAYASEARRMGVRLLPPDVNESEICWKGRGEVLRVGLMSVKGLGSKTMERIVSGRENSAYRSMADFLARVNPDEEEGRALIHARALDSLGTDNHPALLWELARRKSDKAAGTSSGTLFESSGSALPDLPQEDERERMRNEFRILGFLCDCHPMSLFEQPMKKLGTISSVELEQHIGRKVRVAGMLITGKVVNTKHGEPMEFLTFEDENGLMETTFFPKVYHRFCHILEKRRVYLLSGRVEEEFGAVTLNVDSITGLRA